MSGLVCGPGVLSRGSRKFSHPSASLASRNLKVCRRQGSGLRLGVGARSGAFEGVQGGFGKF